MNDKFILDEHGEPVRCDDLLTWAKWFESADRTVAHDLLARDGDGGRSCGCRRCSSDSITALA